MKQPGGWRLATLMLAAVTMCPIVMVALFFAMSIRLAFTLMGYGGGGGGGGLLHLLLLRDLLPGGGEREKIPVYSYVVQDGHRRVSVRQEGDFRDGTIEVGDEVRLFGRERGNTLLVASGENLTTSAQLTFPANLWKGAFVVIFCVAAVGWFALLSSGLALQ
jgi:hypothetical protein